ncbi:hypothetical protein F53441_575 [Fusarium austroafricanum]|uniref:PHD-type domain-containing protein n=1 Tax=Fusarium austroafricanum TaxID=2364996 RepID=A0A8H4KU55_9HYPO|nr:hypothetical protein F53441_575 [Fusarium austroafricanum]
MAPASPTPRRPVTGRRRGRPPGSTNAARAARAAALAAGSVTEPPPKRRRYIPGGAGGGGRFTDVPLIATPSTTGPSTISRSRAAAREAINGPSPSLMPRRERGARTRASGNDDLEEMQWGSAAAMATAVKQAEDYKPREERSWEDFHPNLDIEATFMVLRSEQVDGITQEQSDTSAIPTFGTPLDETRTPSRQPNPASTGNTPNPQGRSESNAVDAPTETPLRRPRRPTRDVVSFYSSKPMDLFATPKTPKILPIQNQTPKEKLDLKLPSYRKTNRIELFESKTFGQARYVDKSMSNVGYQESDHYMRPDQTLIKSSDLNAEDDAEMTDATATSDEPVHHTRIGRVEYDMDEQDDMWLEQHNAYRKKNELGGPITREVFEITMTKIEKEWHALEKRIPKPNPKPPQTHRPRSSSAAAVNGEPQGGEEPDSKCAICDDGDCENTNAIVFCDGCNLAVHQECYGVPFIPEGQWLCRKCLLCGRGVPTCIFCPNTDGAFKQTNSSKWAHLLCAMWIPEVSLGNHTFMEPVMDVEKVPKNRWKLTCYICRQRMGACIQCGNKNCYQAFHVTCARRSRLFLKMKTSQGALAVLDGGMVLKAFCDKHCPLDYAQEHDVHQATKAAKKFYKRTMRNRIWADNTAVANAIAAQQLLTEQPSDESQVTGTKSAASGDKKKGQSPKNMWKTPAGAPIIPQAVFEVVEASIQRFQFQKRKNFLGEACRYWTLKREQRRGAALLKRLQLQMESFSSMELTRRDFAAMGPSGKARLARRIEFAENLIGELEQLKHLASQLVEREQVKVDVGELEQEFVDECYFPVAKLLSPAVDRAISLDKDLFKDRFDKLQDRINARFYVTVMSFAVDLCDIISTGISTTPPPDSFADATLVEAVDAPSVENNFSDIRERRKLGRRILKAVRPFLEVALRVESEISQKPFEGLKKELESIIDRSVDARPLTATSHDKPTDLSDEANDTIMVDADLQITVKASSTEGGDAMDTTSDGGNIEVSTNIDVDTSDLAAAGAVEKQESLPNTVETSATPPDTDGYVSKPQPAQSGPPTPPQSNGSLGLEPVDPLADGGILWYLKGHDPKGTSVLEERWAGRDAVRMLSEDLTDLDDEELKGLGMDVDHASVSAAAEADVKNEVEPMGGKTRASKAKKRRTSTRRR